MGWVDWDEIEAQSMADNRASARRWTEPWETPDRNAGQMQPTTDPGEYSFWDYIKDSLKRANLRPTPQLPSLYDENALISDEPIREATIRNYTGEDYARGDFVGQSSRGNGEPYYQNALPKFIPVVGGKSLLGGVGAHSPGGAGWADDLKGYDNPLPSPTRPDMPVGDKALFPGMEDQTGDILTAVLATMGLPTAIRGATGITSGLTEQKIMDILASRGITNTGLKEAVPGLASKMEGRSWIGDLVRGGTGITPESLRGFVGGFTRAKNVAKGAAQGAGNVFRGIMEPPPSSVAQKIVGEKATKSFLPREFNEDRTGNGPAETLWGQLQRLKGMGSEGLQSMQTPARNIANTWGPNPDIQKALYDYVVRQRNPWGG